MMNNLQRSPAKRLWYRFLYLGWRLCFIATCRVRVRGRNFEPRAGGVLIMSNHQSHLDPILVGISCQRRLNFLARNTLFDFAPLGWLIHSVDAIPIEREGAGMGGIKEALRRLKSQEMVLVFPEGTRSLDGKLGPLKGGFCMLARRGQVPLLPVAVAGSFYAWPRQRLWPRPSVINVQFGPPLGPDDYQHLDDDQLVAEIQARITACHALAQAGVQRAREGAWKAKCRK